jgi:glycosyltransferase involved in cell wall biosynthesis
MRPKISVITTVLNNERFIEDTIKSVIHQNYDNYEYIITDGGSTDGTIDIIKRYEDKIDHWVSEKDKGLYYGMDKGIRLSSGEYFCILSSDDYFLNSETLSKAAEFIEKNNSDFYFGDVYSVERHTKKISKKTNSGLKKIMVKNSVPHMALFMRKKDYIRLGGFDFSYRVAADYDLLLRMILHGLQGIKMDLIVGCRRKGGYSSQYPYGPKEGIEIRKKNKILTIPVIYCIYYRLILMRTMKRMIKSLIFKS